MRAELRVEVLRVEVLDGHMRRVCARSALVEVLTFSYKTNCCEEKPNMSCEPATL